MSGAELLHATLDSTYRSQGLAAPDGRPLHGYSLNEEASERLATVVTVALNQWRKLSPYTGDLAAAGFCLLSSRWASENYSGGSWHWGLATSRLKCAICEDHSVMRELVQRGMRWWKRDAAVVRLSQTNRWLMTLVAEGGLPLGALHRESSRIAQFLLALLHACERDPALRPRVEAERLKDRLPRALRGETVLDLAVLLIHDVARIRGELRAAKASDVETDRRVSEELRRGGFAVRGGEAAASDLVRKLVGRPAREPAESSAVPARCETWLAVELDSESRLIADVRRRVRLVRRATQAGLASVLDTTANGIEALGGRFRLVAHGGGKSIQVGRVARQDDYRLEPFEHDGQLDPMRAVRLSAEGASADTPPADLAGGGRMPDNAPWVFTDAPGGYKLLGTGDVSTRSTSVIVALPAECQADVSGANEYAEVGRIVARRGFAERPLFRVSGRLSLSVDGHTISIETNAVGESDSVYRFVGKRIYLADYDGGACWLGLPTLERLTEEGTFVSVPATRVKWRPRDGHWGGATADCLGEVSCRAMDEQGRLAFASRCIVLPAETTFRISDTTMGRGTLTIDGLGATQVTLNQPVEGATVEFHDLAGGVKAIVRGDSAQRRIRLDVGWRIGRACLTVTNPVPIHGFRRGDRLIPPGQVVTPDDLGLITAEASGRVTPTLVVQGQARHLAELRESTVGTWRLPLRVVQDHLQAMVAAQDAGTASAIRLSVEIAGTAPSAIGLILRAHANVLHVKTQKASSTLEQVLEPHSESPGFQESSEVLDSASSDEVITKSGSTLSVTEDAVRRSVGAVFWLSGEDSTGAVIECRPLADMGREPIRIGLMSPPEPTNGDLERTELDPVPPDETTQVGSRWKFDFNGHEPGAWLATVCRDERLIAHGRLVMIPDGGNGPRLPTRLEAIVNETVEEQRRKLWQSEVAAMAREPGHELWNVIEAMAGQCGRIPPCTFDALRAVASNPAAAALLVVRSRYRDLVLEHFETMPMLWALVPADAWRTAFIEWGKYYHELLTGPAGMETDQAAELTRSELAAAVETIGRPEGLRAVCAWAVSQVEPRFRPTLPWDTKVPRAALIGQFLLPDYWTRTVRNEPALLRDTMPPALDYVGLRSVLPAERHWLAVAPLLAASIASGRQVLPLGGVVMLKLARVHDPLWFDRASELVCAWLLSEKV